jgi:phage baseplate assembly protein W
MRSISIPFGFNGGRVSTTTDPDTIARQKIIDVMLTNRFERMGVPNYGAGVQGLLYEPIDSLVTSDFKLDAIAEIHRRVKDVTIHDIVVEESFIEESEVRVTVYYALPLSQTRTLVFTLPDVLTEESAL